MSYEKLNVYCRYHFTSDAFDIFHIDLRSLPFWYLNTPAAEYMRLSFAYKWLHNTQEMFDHSRIAHETRVIERKDVERCDERCWEGNTLNAEETEHGRFCLVGEGKRSPPIARLDGPMEKSVAVTSNTHDSATSIIWYINAAIDLEIAIFRLRFLCLINDILIDQVTLARIPFASNRPTLISSDLLTFILLISCYLSPHCT